ncbi:MAG: D-cysteine desulfhydrase family protein [Lachnospiraceae bacterium]|nr:D-cysteine desulfhydrase family protein [Lachnospiraceae bacterium]
MGKNTNKLKKIPLMVAPTPLYRLERISEAYGKNIWIKRDDMCGVALGGNKVRKLEYLLADAVSKNCDIVYTAGAPQSNHAMLTAACAARLGMKSILMLKKRGVTEERGNIVLDKIFGAEVRFFDTDDYRDIYEEMERDAQKMEQAGHRCYQIPVGGSVPLGSAGYADCVREITMQAEEAGINPDVIVSATGSGGTTAGLLAGAKLHLPGTEIIGIDIDNDDFEEKCVRLAADCCALLGHSFERRSGDFRMISHYGAGYSIPNAEDTPYMLEMARKEGILLDPVYTGKAFAGMLIALRDGSIEAENVIFVHTGGAAALFAMELG